MTAENMRSNKFSNVLKLSGREISCKTEGDVVCKSSIVLEVTRSKATICPYGVPLGEAAKVRDLVCFLNELFRTLEVGTKSCHPWRGGKEVVKKVDRVMV